MNEHYLFAAPKQEGWDGLPRACTMTGQSFRGASSAGGYCLAGTLILLGLIAAPGAHAAPAGGSIAAGSGKGDITQSGTVTTITQNSDRLAINWNSFSSKTGESIVFNQPGTSAIALNRVTGAGASELHGSLTANGQVFILNPNGVLFGAGATVKAQGLLASTLGMSIDSFMNGGQTHGLDGAGAGSVINQGSLTAYPGGYVALLSPKVINQGMVSAQQGHVLMAAGDSATVQLSGTSLVSYRIDRGALDALVDNGATGSISANGGKVTLDAKAAEAIGKAVVNHAGVIEAQTLGSDQQGTVRLLAGTQAGEVTMSGQVDVSATANGGAGNVETSAAKVRILDGAMVKTGGQWRIDAGDFSIVGSRESQTGSSVSAATLEANLAANPGSTIRIRSNSATPGVGDLLVQAPVAWRNARLELSADRNIRINANLNAQEKAALHLQTGQGDGASGDYVLNNARVNLAGDAAFSTQNGLNGPVMNYTVITGLGKETGSASDTLQGMASGQNYVLGTDIDAADTGSWNGGAGFTPIMNFRRIFDGLGHEISGLVIRQPQQSKVGLFGVTGNTAAIRNIGVVNADITGADKVGIVAGENNGSIDGAYSTGKVSAAVLAGNDGTNVGGLVGINFSIGTGNAGAINRSWSSASVTGKQRVGGLVGFLVQGRVSNSYATGAVMGEAADVPGREFAGGLVGDNLAIIRTSYATGNVSGAAYVGGLVGANRDAALIEDSYATGDVAGNTNVGGLAGSGNGSAIFRNTYASGRVTAQAGGRKGGLAGDISPGVQVINSYWNIDVAGGNDIGAGRTGKELMRLATFQDAWSISGAGGSDAVWRIYEGSSMPLLRAFLSDVTLADKTVTFNGALQSGALAAGDPRRSMTAASGVNVGSYRPSSTQQGYDISGGTLDITPAPLTVTTADVNKIYDGTVAAAGRLVISEGVLYGGKLNGGVFAFTDRNAGNNKTVTVSGVTIDDGNNGSNYSLRLAPNLSSTISPAPLSVIANSDGKSFDRIPYRGGNGVTYAGLIAGDSLASLQGQLVYGGSAQGAVLPGAYRITPGGLGSANYAISFVDGALRIDQPRDLSAGFGLLNPMALSGPERTPRTDGAPVRIAGCGLALPEAMLVAECVPAAAPGAR